MTLREKSRENNYERYVAKVLPPQLQKTVIFFVLPLQEDEMKTTMNNAIYELVHKDETRLVKISLSHRLEEDQNRAITDWINPQKTGLKFWKEILNHLEDDLTKQNSLQNGPAWARLLADMKNRHKSTNHDEKDLQRIKIECELFFKTI